MCSSASTGGRLWSKASGQRRRGGLLAWRPLLRRKPFNHIGASHRFMMAKCENRGGIAPPMADGSGGRVYRSGRDAWRGVLRRGHAVAVPSRGPASTAWWWFAFGVLEVVTPSGRGLERQGRLRCRASLRADGGVWGGWFWWPPVVAWGLLSWF